MRVVVYLLFLFSCLSESWAQPYKYWIQTTRIDHLWLITPDGPEEIPSEGGEHTTFRLELESIDSVFIKMSCAHCQNKIAIMILSRIEDAYTKCRYFDPIREDSIQLQEVFHLYLEKDNLTGQFSSLEDIWFDFQKSFLRSVNTLSSYIPKLKSPTKLNPGDPKLVFQEAGSMYYLDSSSITIPFATLNGYPIQTVYLLDQDGQLILCAGDVQLFTEYPELAQLPTLAVQEIVSSAQANKEKSIHSISYDQLSQYLSDDLRPDQWYQLGIILDNDDFSEGEYLFKFQIISQKELEAFKEFFD